MEQLRHCTINTIPNGEFDSDGDKICVQAAEVAEIDRELSEFEEIILEAAEIADIVEASGNNILLNNSDENILLVGAAEAIEYAIENPASQNK